MAFLRALSKMGLVELDPKELAELEKKSKKTPEMSMEDIDKLLAEEEAKDKAQGKAPAGTAPGKPQNAAAAPHNAAPADVRPASAPPRAASAGAVVGGGGVRIARDFDELYRQAAVPPAPYAAEKLLRLLDGLGAMDEHTRRTAVLAMDSADDSWTIADPVMDAKRKMKVLAEEKVRLADQLLQADAAAKEELARLDAFQEAAQKTVREKIAALEAQLQKEMQEIADRRAQRLGLLEKDKTAAAVEHDRLDRELARLDIVPRSFEPLLRDAQKS